MPPGKFSALQPVKANIVRLHAWRRAKILLDRTIMTRWMSKNCIFHVLKMLRRRYVREISQVQHSHGNTYATPNEITNTVVTLLCQKYSRFDADNASVSTLLIFIHHVGQTKYVELLEKPFTSELMLRALRSGARHKSPGIDCICLEFYTGNWESMHANLVQLLNHVFQHKNISRGRNMGS